MFKSPILHPSPINKTDQESARLAADITRDASAQTYFTIRLLADRELAPDAYRSYAYFRWVDDILDAETGSKSAKMAFVARQQSLLSASYRGQKVEDVGPEERMLVDLVGHDVEKNSGLRSYLEHMMDVMVFDVERRGRIISQGELDHYSHMLAVAVTDALHYFIGHACTLPARVLRYRAVEGAHVIHMLRDTYEDTEAGYFNTAREFLESSGASPQAVDSPAYRGWVKSRIELARQDFAAGRAYIRQVKNWRCRLAGCAYTARFEWMLRRIERDGYRLRKAYPERKSMLAGLWMAWNAIKLTFTIPAGEKLSKRDHSPV